MKRNSLLYLFVISLVALPLVWVLHLGSALPTPGGTTPAPLAATPQSISALAALGAGLAQNFSDPLSHLFLQLLIIIATSRLMGRLFAACGQPSVVGEMAAGILLGPSLFGLLAPDAFAFVFPATSLGSMELNVSEVRRKAQTAVVVSHASIVFPYFLGVVLAWFVYTDLAAPGATFLAFALFMGISMSITAFPVLARILQERGLSRTLLGSTALTCAAVDDVTAWSLLAFVVAIARATSVGGSALNLLLVIVFIALMVWGVKRALPRWLGTTRLAEENPSKGTLATVICVVVGAAFCTETIGIHALFGAFLAGAIMPDVGGFRHKLCVRVENFSSVLLLPLFFAFIGLRTQIGLLNDWSSWLICFGIIAVATVGKLGGTAVTARLTGMTWSDSLQLGALMNTRGLMELIALNIGYDLGILSPRIFAMLVIMALATTMLTGPLLTLFGRPQPFFDETPEPARS